MLQLLLTCTLVLALCPWLINRWRFRHIPGPFAPPVIGNLLLISKMDMTGFLEHCRQKYGKVFKIYAGSAMLVCVADPVAAKRMLGKLNFRHAGVQLLAGADDWDFLVDGLVGANGDSWRTLRAAWQPAFSPTALQSYLPATHTAIEGFLQRLAAAAACGEVVEVTKELTALTLDVVGQAAYGVDLQNLQQQEQQPQAQQGGSSQGGSLLGSMQRVFDGGGVSNSSNYMAPLLLFPALTALWQWLAFNLPDSKLRHLAQARQHIKRVSSQLVRSWRQHSHPAAAAAAGHLDAASTAAAANEHTAPPSPVQQPGVFPRTLLERQDSAPGQELTDDLVVAQLNTFLLAAFETTAAAISFCVYFIAQHPAVEERLLQELHGAQQVAAAARDQPGPEWDVRQLPYTEAIVLEALRLLPPGSIATRLTQQQGYQLNPQVWLPPGVGMFACIYCFHRDPDYWPHALSFRPERWLPEGSALQPHVPDAYMPFGGGSRQCIGRQFALQAVVLAVARMYSQYRFELAPGQVPLAVKQTFALVPARGLRVRVFRRTAGAVAAAS